MPNSRKIRTCSKCGRRTKGHLGSTGVSCRMDELLKEEITQAQVPSDIAEDAQSDLIVPDQIPVESDRESVSSGNDSDPDTDSKLQLLTNQVSLLTVTVNKLVRREESVVTAKPVVTTRSKVQKVKQPDTSAVGKPSKKVPEVELPTTKSLARDKELSALLESYQRGESEFQASYVSDKGATKSSLVSASGGEKKKALFIYDYISRIGGTVDEYEDSLITSGGVKLTFKTKAKKLDPSDVTAAMWISANSRIYEILAVNMSAEQCSEYHEYTRQVGDLLQAYTESSVMVLDHEHRKHVAASGRAWDNISPHLERFHLKVRSSMSENSDVKASHKAQGFAGQTMRKSNRPCFSYNSKAGCKFGEACRFKHKCSERGCGGNHSKLDHDRFRTQTT